MRITFPLCLALLALLAGCASAQPRALATPLPPADASVLQADSMQRIAGQRVTVVRAACETNDPMAVRVPFARGGSARPGAKAGPTPGPSAMPTTGTLGPLPYIPNACPITAGPLSARNLPAALKMREGKIQELAPPQP